jgi:unsaturated rhamnogalacturonyl hydrolase
MGYYFDDRHSMFRQAGMNVGQTLAVIARRYVGFNPPHEPTYRAYSKRGIMRGKDYRYHADFNRFFPGAAAEQFVYAWAKYWSDNPSELKFDVSCFGPITLYCNGQDVFRSNIFTERSSDDRHSVNIPLVAGWNHFVIRFKKTRAGFGGKFGTWLGKLPYYFLMPTPERADQEGWIFTGPMSAELPSLPGPGTTERDTGVKWFPETGWDRTRLRLGQLKRIFGLVPGAVAVGWTQAFFDHPGTGRYRLTGRHSGPITISIADKEVFRAAASGRIAATVRVPFGRHDVMVVATCKGVDWGFELALELNGQPVPWASPCNIVGTSEPWLFLGPLAASARLDFPALRDLHRVTPGVSGDTYWRVDLPEAWVRPYNENLLYGRWNYPLGVTLYGLLHGAKAIGSAEIEQYVVNHVQYCCDTFHYALWDKEQYGGATAVHHLLSSIDSLDDCGSFGSAMLEVARHAELRGYREIADFVADYISKKQIRLPDGTFFRKNLMHVFHENTMWADDLYMSVPFLCRYYQLTGDRRFVDDAARQFLGFKKYLFIPELKIMSHVYDFKRQMATGVPWGRGNGWTIFSLSELLAVLPEKHPLRPDLLGFFRDLCAGYLALQDEAGMWHQVLTHPDAYPETSCTSMFTYAFARGIQYGWFERPAPYVRAVFKAWEALNRTSIDKGGNIYGVCRGSEFSFTPEYYKKELLWNLNDTHGIGIVLLAGVEVMKLIKHLEG